MGCGRGVGAGAAGGLGHEMLGMLDDEEWREFQEFKTWQGGCKRAREGAGERGEVEK